MSHPYSMSPDFFTGEWQKQSVDLGSKESKNACRNWSFYTRSLKTCHLQNYSVEIYIGKEFDESGAKPGLALNKMVNGKVKRLREKQMQDLLRETYGIKAWRLRNCSASTVAAFLKDEEDLSPDELAESKLDNHTKMIRLRDSFRQTPTFDDWARIVYQRIGPEISDRDIRNLYQNWPKIGEPILLKAIRLADIEINYFPTGTKFKIL